MDDRADAHLRLSQAALDMLNLGEIGDPFALLGPHDDAFGRVVRAYLPHAEGAEALDGDQAVELEQVQMPGLFVGRIRRGAQYRLRIRWPGGLVQETEAPYAFGLLLGEMDL
jgi:1,4-alpha-glucan branching enzyme